MITEAQLEKATPGERKDVVKAAVDAASDPEKKEVAAAAVDALTGEQRKELIESLWPSESIDRRWVYIAGFCVAAAVALGLALIAWGASGGENSVATSVIVLATGFSSAILGGLLGAYVQK
jgi:hypothetical protein